MACPPACPPKPEGRGRSPERRRGGQPGNRNRWRHGAYSTAARRERETLRAELRRIDFQIQQALAWHACETGKPPPLPPKPAAARPAATVNILLFDDFPWPEEKHYVVFMRCVRGPPSAIGVSMSVLRISDSKPRARPGIVGFDRKAHFQDVYERGGPFLRALAARFDLPGKRALALASGSAAEEIALAQAGVAVDVVEPMAPMVELARERTAALAPSAPLEFHVCRAQDYDAAGRYDLIYTSCPQDWMSSDFRLLVPDDYMALFARYAAPRCVLVVRFWSASYSHDVLSSTWFPKALAERFRSRSDFALREYWLGASRKYAVAVVTRGYGELVPGEGFAATVAARFGEPSSLQGRWPAGVAVAPSPQERLTPHILAVRHAIRAVRMRARKRARALR